MLNKIGELEKTVNAEEKKRNLWRRNMEVVSATLSGSASAYYFIEGNTNYGALFAIIALGSSLIAADSHLAYKENKK